MLLARRARAPLQSQHIHTSSFWGLAYLPQDCPPWPVLLISGPFLQTYMFAHPPKEFSRDTGSHKESKGHVLGGVLKGFLEDLLLSLKRMASSQARMVSRLICVELAAGRNRVCCIL